MTPASETKTLTLPAMLDATAGAKLIAEMNKLPRSGAIRLEAAAVTSLPLGYLQILVSAFKTFPQLGVCGASPEFAEAFAGYGLTYPVAPAIEPASEPLPVSAIDDAPAAGAIDAPAEIQPSNGAAMPKTILTIDDSRTMRDMLKMALGGAGFRVLQAVDGEDGLSVLAQQPVDLIITDINMPKLDGYGVIRAVRKDPTYDHTPILVLSTEGEQESKDIAKGAGATGWVVKPFDPDNLVKLVNTVCA
jgi:two-component system chemotaxis response regulator CheY